jgi:serine/threonine-protein kinase
VRLHLERQEWLVGEQLGGGGFGQVYGAKSTAGDTAAVKLVPKAPGAERELLFVDLADARNVVPIIDRGETEDSWVLVMPRAEKSLRQHLKEAAGPLETADVVTILSDIAAALVDLDGRVVHRDLKPENVLLLDGRWCLADFGIARYAEATTAPDTRKYAWTKPYAAPEQWREERATSATDVYALGIIAYELLAGSRPFAGPDFREQHLHNTPPSLPGIPATLDALVQECLYKAPAARPSPANLSARLGVC